MKAPRSEVLLSALAAASMTGCSGLAEEIGDEPEAQAEPEQVAQPQPQPPAEARPVNPECYGGAIGYEARIRGGSTLFISEDLRQAVLRYCDSGERSLESCTDVTEAASQLWGPVRPGARPTSTGTACYQETADSLGQ